MNIACYIRNDAVFEQAQSALTRAGFACNRFVSEPLLLRTVRRRSFDFVVADLGLEFEENEGIFSWLKCRGDDSVPVLLLSPDKATSLAVHSLNAGADDFVARPFDAAELVARIRAILRRCDRLQVRRTIEIGGFALDQDASSFAYEGTPIELTPREFTMAWLFFSSHGSYISRETLSTTIWGTGSEVAGRTIEQHVYKLRKKLQSVAGNGVVIRTAYSQGYRLELPNVEQRAAA
jgi:DNA-binding response OmpR family regulator